MAESSLHFALDRISLRSDGSYELTGSTDRQQSKTFDKSKYGIVLIGRTSKQEQIFPARQTGTDGTSVHLTCLIEAAAITIQPNEIIDFSFAVLNQHSEHRTRIGMNVEAGSWLPYSTVYGNLSFKRKPLRQ